MNREIIAKQLIKVAKQLVASQSHFYCKLIDKGPVDVFTFKLKIVEKMQSKYYGKLSQQIYRMNQFFQRKLNVLQKQFKESDFTKNVSVLGVSENLFFIDCKTNTLQCQSLLRLEVDLDGSGTEYTWTSTKDILKRNGFNDLR